MKPVIRYQSQLLYRRSYKPARPRDQPSTHVEVDRLSRAAFPADAPPRGVILARCIVKSLKR
jgi:hypothetical protein